MALPTTLDYLHATMYAINKTHKDKCLNQDLLKILPGMIWKDTPNNQLYPCPENLKDCQSGKCTINQDLCKKISQSPFNPDGSDIITSDCKTDNDCNNLPYKARCGDNNKCAPINPYVVWNPDINKCVYGNSALKKWCEVPSTRDTEKVPGLTNVPPFYFNEDTSKCYITKQYCDFMDTKYNKKSCNTDTDCATTKKWVTDKVCSWDSSKAKCKSSDPDTTCSYQYKFGDMTLSQSCRVDRDSTNSSAPGDKCVNGYCVGTGSECKTTSSEEAGQFFLGKTIYRFFDEAVKGKMNCGAKEGFQYNQKELKVLADQKFIKNKNKIGDNFGGEGINLYTFEWDDKIHSESINNLKINDIGFLSDEIEKFYPELIKKNENNIKYISISVEQVKLNPKYKRIYIISTSNKWVINNIISGLKIMGIDYDYLKSMKNNK